MGVVTSLVYSLDLYKLLDKVCHISCSIVESPATDNYQPSMKKNLNRNMTKSLISALYSAKPDLPEYL